MSQQAADPQHDEAVPEERALQPTKPALPANRVSRLPAVVARALPMLTRSAGAVAAGLAAEYALRALSGRALKGIASSVGRTVTVRTVPAPARRVTTRRVVTEILIIERRRRRV